MLENIASILILLAFIFIMQKLTEVFSVNKKSEKRN